MLKAEGDGFTVDFTLMIGKEELSSDEQLLVKLRTAAEAEKLSRWTSTRQRRAARALLLSDLKKFRNGRRMFWT